MYSLHGRGYRYRAKMTYGDFRGEGTKQSAGSSTSILAAGTTTMIKGSLGDIIAIASLLILRFPRLRSKFNHCYNRCALFCTKSSGDLECLLVTVHVHPRDLVTATFCIYPPLRILGIRMDILTIAPASSCQKLLEHAMPRAPVCNQMS